MYTDVPEAELRRYQSSQTEPDDSDAYGEQTPTEARSYGGEVRPRPVSTGLTTMDTFDVTVPGSGGTGQRVAAPRVPCTGCGAPAPQRERPDRSLHHEGSASVMTEAQLKLRRYSYAEPPDGRRVSRWTFGPATGSVHAEIPDLGAGLHALHAPTGTARPPTSCSAPATLPSCWAEPAASVRRWGAMPIASCVANRPSTASCTAWKLRLDGTTLHGVPCAPGPPPRAAAR
ncbi:hypothetical protein GQF42_43675 [Streptomyces broussonetiae]|uniref:Uncharacterized protein n=1 Tax=Streptomyces broussonetiae TaxID=2686304 RepID=A0A6I6NJP8_9ACTN|nr:hypothetical protein GQF42_43675 [Streptomyces broussonetiae]